MSCFICFWPLGLIAVIKARQAQGAIKRNSFEEARKLGKVRDPVKTQPLNLAETFQVPCPPVLKTMTKNCSQEAEKFAMTAVFINLGAVFFGLILFAILAQNDVID